MLFNSFEFAVFFPIVTILFFLFPHRYRWLLLLLASCFFYMFFKAIYIFILLFTIVIDYCAGILISREQRPGKRKLLLLASIVANVGVLMVFKYYNFVADNVNQVLHAANTGRSIPFLNILLPIGLSFHTFQAMSYTIEVYKRRQEPERHFGIYALYVMFYPQLVAGPIERPQNVLHQFHEIKRFDYANMRSGLTLMAWGLFKKVVIADRLALFVSGVYGSPFDNKGLPLIIATVFFAFQIYCDFSGYSDIAIGSARCMGFELMNNFDRPYQSAGFGEFWHRWHISLSTWFRDYVYIPLGGSRVVRSRMYLNIMIVFLLSGLWHGANWTFVVWGFLHGLFLVMETSLYRKFPGLKQPSTGVALLLKRLLVFSLVTVAWIFFRAADVGQAFYIVRHLFTGIPQQIKDVLGNRHYDRLQLLYLHQPSGEFFLAILLLFALGFVQLRQKKDSFDTWLFRKPTYIRWPVYYALVIVFICFGIFNRSEFIYFQF